MREAPNLGQWRSNEEKKKRWGQENAPSGSLTHVMSHLSAGGVLRACALPISPWGLTLARPPCFVLGAFHSAPEE
jgi:hypothetical protein